MIAPLVLFLLSLAGLAVALAVPDLFDLVLLAGPSALASLFLLLRALLRRDRHAAPMVVLDGSNVMHWKDGTARLETLREVIRHLVGLGFVPGVVFDANAGHILAGRYMHNRAMGRLLGLPEDHVIVVPKGEPADPTILAAARHLGARIVTNDRYRDWAHAHPELRDPGYLIRGGYRDGRLWLDVDRTGAEAPVARPARA